MNAFRFQNLKTKKKIKASDRRNTSKPEYIIEPEAHNNTKNLKQPNPKFNLISFFHEQLKSNY